MKIRDNRDKNWFWLDNEYLNGYAKHLGASCTVVYLSLCRFAHNEKQTCFPSMDTIAEQNGIHRATVIRALKKLEQWNIIAVERAKKEDGTQANNIYTLLSKNEWKEKPSSNMQHGETELQKVKKPSSNKLQNRVAQCNNNYTNINYTKDNNTKRADAQEISFLLKKFEEIDIKNKNYYKNTTQRKACEFLLKEYGEQVVNKVLAFYIKARRLQETGSVEVRQKYRFIPTITSPYDLQEKWGKLADFVKRTKQEQDELNTRVIF